MTVYECGNCKTGVVSVTRPKKCGACGAGEVFMQNTAEVALPGMERAALERLAAFAESEAAKLSAKMREPLGSVSRSAGKMERDAPLFHGTGENPGLF